MHLLMTALLAGPAWTADIQVSPELAELVVHGTGAPDGVVLLPRRSKTLLTIEGPAKLTLRFIGLRERKGKKLGKPGRARVRVDKAKKKKMIRARKKMMKGGTVEDHAKWFPTRERTHMVKLDAGTHTIQIQVLRDARVGMGLAVDIERDEPAPPAEPPLPPEPPADEPTDVPADVPADEPVIPEPDEPAIPEPDLVLGSETPAREPSIQVVGKPAQHAIRGPHGEETFLVASIDEGLQLDVNGPCVVVVDLHAHRSEAELESLRPVIVGVMIDEVLLQTLAVDQPASSSYSVDAPYVPSDRVTLRVPIEGGRHGVRLTLSDAAVLGMSIRPQLQTLAAVEPGLLSATGARANDLRAEDADEVYGTVGIGALGAGFLPSSLTHFGWLVRGDVDLAIPVAGPRFSIGLSGGYLTVLEPRSYADPRAESGRGRVNLTITEVPVLAEARWSAPVPSPFGVELGVGGGVLLVWTEIRALHAERTDGLEVAPAGVAQLTLMLEAGPGVFTLGGGFILGKPIDSATLGRFDPGGAWAGFGYRFVIGG